jgi:Protein of unknown function (DUF3467)
MRNSATKSDRLRLLAVENRKDDYANFFQIGHNAAEFLLEFGQEEGRIIHTRIYMSPQHAQILADLLADALKGHAERN